MREHSFFQPLIVMEFADEEIRMVWIPAGVSHRRHRLTGVTCDQVPLPAGVIDQGNLRQPQIFTRIIRAYFDRMGWGSAIRVFFSVPIQQSLMRHFVLPWIPKRHRKTALGFLVGEEVPIPVKDLVYDYAVVGENQAQNNLRVLVGAARNSVVQGYVQALEQAGVRVKGVGFAVASSGDTLHLSDQEDTLYLSSVGNVALLVLFRGNIPEIIRTFGPAQLNESLRGEESREIEHLLMYYGVEHSKLAVRKVLYNGSWAGQLAAGLRQSGVVAVEEPARLEGVTAAFQALASANGDFILLIGYAYAILRRRDPLRIRPANYSEITWRHLTTLVSVLGICLLVAGFAFWYPWRIREHRLQTEVAQMRDQGRRTETLLRGRRELSAGWKQAMSHPFRVGDNLVGVNSISIPGLVLNRIEYKDGALLVHGQAGQGSQIEQMMRELRAMGWDRPNLTAYQQTGDNITFALNAEAKP